MATKRTDPLGYLVQMEGNQIKDWWPLYEHAIVGRGAGADVQVGHHAISNVHAEIHRVSGAHVISNTHGRFGTSVDGKKLDRLESSPLGHGVTVRFADAVEMVYYPNGTLPIEVGNAVKGRLEVDCNSGNVRAAGIDISNNLTFDQLKLLCVLCSHPGRPVSGEEIARGMARPGEVPVFAKDPTHKLLSRLRKTLDHKKMGWRYVKSLRGRGWELLEWPEDK